MRGAIIVVAQALLLSSGLGSERDCYNGCEQANGKFCGNDNKCYTIRSNLTCGTWKNQFPGLSNIGPVSCTKSNVAGTTLYCGEIKETLPIYERCEGRDFKCYGPSDVSSEKARMDDFVDNFLEKCNSTDKLIVSFYKFGVAISGYKYTDNEPWVEGTTLVEDSALGVVVDRLRKNNITMARFKRSLAHGYMTRSLNLVASGTPAPSTSSTASPTASPTSVSAATASPTASTTSASSRSIHSLLSFALLSLVVNSK
mmetsp:Transcript_3067/g.6515  ORF Transcript_3067/g.6515 Transcript_3067/m.6515 type:complete len:256 (-) Transcript_3067:608-1375(-)